VAPVTDQDLVEPAEAPASPPIELPAEDRAAREAAPSEQENALPERRLGKLIRVSILAAAVVVVAIAGYFLMTRRGAHTTPPKNVSIAVLPFSDMSSANDQEY